MKDEVAIICSLADPASLNIAERLLELESWDDHEGYKSSGPWRLIIHSERQTVLRGVDKRLYDLGLRPNMVVFACRHESEGNVPWFGGHFTGIFGNGHCDLSAAAPWGLRSFLQNIRDLAPKGFRISAEATHHGPTDMKTPSFFAEIGSSEHQWHDPRAGEAVARSILSLERIELPIFLGFGGGHYMQRQTNLIFEAGIAFGHLFSSYQASALDPVLVDRARRMSFASYAYLDRKSLKSDDRKKIVEILDKLSIPLLRGKEIRFMFPSPQRKCLQA